MAATITKHTHACVRIEDGDRALVIDPGGFSPSWAEAHHLREWDADTGPTDLHNLALVCWEHHQQLHRHGQHLHPPWCHCPQCHHHPGTWTTSKAPPQI